MAERGPEPVHAEPGRRTQQRVLGFQEKSALGKLGTDDDDNCVCVCVCVEGLCMLGDRKCEAQPSDNKGSANEHHFPTTT